MFDNYKNKGLTGLVNIGNTCFINSCFQILSHTYELNEILNNIDYNKKLNNINDSMLLIEWNTLRKLMWNENCIITPNRFINTIHKLASIKKLDIFSNYYQNDITEFFIFVINCFHNSLSREVTININGDVKNERDFIAKKCYEMIANTYSKEYSEIWDIFYGVQITILSSQQDDSKINYIPESYSILSLSIPNIENPTLIDCFDLYVENEDMDVQQPSLGKKKQIQFWNFPKILVIDLKRYSCDVIHEKNKILVSFPLENLDLSKYILGYNKNIYLYDLYGVCNHIGLNNNSGHYNSFIKNVDEWYQFDDTNIVKITNLNDIVNPNAYCFFYRRKN